MADTSLPIVIIAGLLAGGAGAAATVTLMSPGGGDASGASAQVEELAQLRESNARLAKTLGEYEGRLDMLESLGQMVPPSASGRTGDRVAALEFETDQFVTRAELGDLLKELAEEDLAVVTPAARDTVEAVLEQREEERRKEREQERAERMEELRENRLAEMQQKLGLDNNQLAQMRDQMQASEQAMRDLWSNEDIRSMDREERRDMFTQMREDADQAVRGILTPAQYETYQEEGYDNPFGRRGGGAPRGGNNGGGGRGGRGGF